MQQTGCAEICLNFIEKEEAYKSAFEYDIFE